MPKEIIDVNITGDDVPGKTQDEKTIIWASGLLERARNARADTFERARKNLRMYEGGDKQWDKAMPSYRAKITDNRCFANVESVLPILVDNRPKAEIVAADERDIETVSELKDVYDAKWEDLDLELLTTLSVKDACILTEGYWKVWFDPSKLNPIGDLEVSQVSMFNIFPDPDSVHPLMKDAYYVCYSAPVALSNLLLLYPDKAKKLQASMAASKRSDGGDFPSDENNQDYKGLEAHDSGDTPTTLMNWNRVEGRILDGHEKFTLNEMWVDDHSAEAYRPDFIVYLDNMTAVEKTDAEWSNAIASGREFEIMAADKLPDIGLEDGTKWVRTYPNGRIITWTGNILLDDKPSPYNHGRCPYVRFFRYTVPGKNWFMGEIDQIIPLQEELNKRKSQVIDLMNLTINPPLLVYTSSGIDITKITNRPGAVLPVSCPVDAAAKWMQMPNIPSAMFVQMGQINEDIDTVSGLHDITVGRNPSGITAGIAIQSLQEASQTRPRLGARFVERSLKHATELMLSIIWQYYREPRTIRKKGSNGYIYNTVNFADRELHGDMPSVKINSGSTMPMNKSALKELSIRLAQTMLPDGKPVIDRRALLEVCEYPDYERILERMGDGNIVMQPQGGGTAPPAQGGI